MTEKEREGEVWLNKLSGIIKNKISRVENVFVNERQKIYYALCFALDVNKGSKNVLKYRVVIILTNQNMFNFLLDLNPYELHLFIRN